MIGQLNIYGEDKVTTAIKRLRTFEPTEGYYVAFSGGKDSQVIYHLCEEAGVKFDAHYNITGIDPPELVYFIRESYPDVKKDMYEKSMFELIKKNGLPLGNIRFCCAELKERGGQGRFVVTGVRWAESAKRKNSRNLIEFDVYGSQSKEAKEKREIFLNSDNDEKRNMIENCTVKGKHVLNPIVDWTDTDVWDYLNSRNIEHCKLYDEGYKRLGCIGCPMASKENRKRDLERYPKFAENYKRAIGRWLPGYIERRKAKGEKPLFETVEDWYSWWIEE